MARLLPYVLLAGFAARASAVDADASDESDELCLLQVQLGLNRSRPAVNRSRPVVNFRTNLSMTQSELDQLRAYSALAGNRTATGCDEVNVLTLAHMASAVYALHGSSWIPDSELGHIHGDHFFLHAVRTQPEYQFGGEFIPAFAVFLRLSPCLQAVIALKGTSPSSLTDIRADFAHVVSGIHPSAALADVVTWKNNYVNGGFTVLVTGHSLGGYMGEVLSTTENLPGLVFCAPGPHGPIQNHNGPHLHPKFRNLNAQHDVLGNILPGTYTHAQWSAFMADNSNHGITQAIDFLERCDYSHIHNGNLWDHCSPSAHGYYLYRTGRSWSVWNPWNWR